MPYCQYLFTDGDLKTYAAREGLPTAWPYINGVSVTAYRRLWAQQTTRFEQLLLPRTSDGRRRRGADHEVSLLLPVEGAGVRRSVRLGRRNLSSQAMRVLALENELTSMRGGQESACSTSVAAWQGKAIGSRLPT